MRKNGNRGILGLADGVAGGGGVVVLERMRTLMIADRGLSSRGTLIVTGCLEICLWLLSLPRKRENIPLE